MSAVVKSESKPKTAPRPRILVVDDEPNLVELVGDIGKDMGCRVVSAGDLAEARRIMADQQIDLLVADMNLPDGDGISLLPTLRKDQPNAAAIVITGAPSVENAIGAIRGGAVDFIKKPFTAKQLSSQMRAALDRQAAMAKQEKRIEKLRVAVRRLNEARRTIGKKVDLLCNDLVTAYGELSRQFDGVRNQEGFRKTCAAAKDLEQLLCHAMDWLLREMGYANVAVWLADEEGDFQLGGYRKHTRGGGPPVTNARKEAIVPLATKDGFVRLTDADLVDVLTPAEQKLFKGQDILASNCTYLGDSLAAVVFFRDERSPFSDDDVELLKTVAPVFAVALATVVRGADEEEGGASDDDDAPFFEKPQAQEDATDDAKGGLDDAADADHREPPKKKGGKPKIDPADWWKRGEAPPF